MQHRTHAIVAIKMFRTMKEQLHFSLTIVGKNQWQTNFMFSSTFFLLLNKFEPFEHYSYRASPNTMEIDFCFPENFPSLITTLCLCVSLCVCVYARKHTSVYLQVIPGNYLEKPL